MSIGIVPDAPWAAVWATSRSSLASSSSAARRGGRSTRRPCWPRLRHRGEHAVHPRRASPCRRRRPARAVRLALRRRDRGVRLCEAGGVQLGPAVYDGRSCRRTGRRRRSRCRTRSGARPGARPGRPCQKAPPGPNSAAQPPRLRASPRWACARGSRPAGAAGLPGPPPRATLARSADAGVLMSNSIRTTSAPSRPAAIAERSWSAVPTSPGLKPRAWGRTSCRGARGGRPTVLKRLAGE